MKKGYTTVLDVTIAVLIILIGVLVLFQFITPQKQNDYDTERLSQDVIGVLFHTTIADLCTGISTINCECHNYVTIQNAVCRPLSEPQILDKNANILALMGEMIERESQGQDKVELMFHELFVEPHFVIDETRFGFSILFTDPDTGEPFELYNSETYGDTP